MHLCQKRFFPEWNILHVLHYDNAHPFYSGNYFSSFVPFNVKTQTEIWFPSHVKHIFPFFNVFLFFFFPSQCTISLFLPPPLTLLLCNSFFFFVLYKAISHSFILCKYQSIYHYLLFFKISSNLPIYIYEYNSEKHACI